VTSWPSKFLGLLIDVSYDDVVHDSPMARKLQRRRAVTIRLTIPELAQLECWAETDGSISAAVRDLIADKAKRLLDEEEHQRAKLSQSNNSEAS
jgi:hypothetical protein